MVDVEYINPGTPVAGPYSPGTKTGNFIFVSGQGANPGAVEIKDQVTSVLENVKNIVEAAGGSVSSIVRITVYLRNMGDFSKMNRAYEKFFKDNGVKDNFPARTTIEVSNLPISAMLLEMDAIAVI